MQGGRQTLLYAAIFLVIAVVMMSVNDIVDAVTPVAVEGFGPDALPFVCDFAKEGAGPDDMEARFTLTFDTTSDGPFPHCASLTRGTAIRPREGSETVCLGHKDATLPELWQDAAGGTLTILETGAATYLRRERVQRDDAFAETTDIAYAGSCMRGM